MALQLTFVFCVLVAAVFTKLGLSLDIGLLANLTIIKQQK